MDEICETTGQPHVWVLWDERPRGGVFWKCEECEAQPSEDDDE